MKQRYIAACILIVGGIAFFLLQPGPKPEGGVPEGTIQEPEPNRPIAIKQSHEPSANVNATNDPLAGAYETAAFIDRIHDSVPAESVSTRTMMKGLQVAFFLSDYVMTAKTNKELVLTTSAIVAAFTNISQDTSHIESRLRTYADFPGTLSDHYRSISEIPKDRESIKAIEAALTENNVAIDTESDLLMDCIRYAYVNGFIHEMYGPNPTETQAATPFPAALNSLVNATDAVFEHRFETRFGLQPATVTNLMKRLREVHIRNISDAGFQIPAQIR